MGANFNFPPPDNSEDESDWRYWAKVFVIATVAIAAIFGLIAVLPR